MGVSTHTAFPDRLSGVQDRASEGTPNSRQSNRKRAARRQPSPDCQVAWGRVHSEMLLRLLRRKDQSRRRSCFWDRRSTRSVSRDLSHGALIRGGARKGQDDVGCGTSTSTVLLHARRSSPAASQTSLDRRCAHSTTRTSSNHALTTAPTSAITAAAARTYRPMTSPKTNNAPAASTNTQTTIFGAMTSRTWAICCSLFCLFARRSSSR
jgi:hypothetical protein